MCSFAWQRGVYRDGAPCNDSLVGIYAMSVIHLHGPTWDTALEVKSAAGLRNYIVALNHLLFILWENIASWVS
jgi:hypothetical protein